MQFDGDWSALRGEAFALRMKQILASGDIDADIELLQEYREEMLAFTAIWSRLCIKWTVNYGVADFVTKAMGGLYEAMDRIEDAFLKDSVERTFASMGKSFVYGLGLSFLDTRAVGKPDMTGIHLVFSVDGVALLDPAPIEKKYPVVAEAVCAVARHKDPANFVELVDFCQSALTFFDFLMSKKSKEFFPRGITQEFVESLHLETDATEIETTGKYAARFLQAIYLTDIKALEKMVDALQYPYRSGSR